MGDVRGEKLIMIIFLGDSCHKHVNVSSNIQYSKWKHVIDQTLDLMDRQTNLWESSLRQAKPQVVFCANSDCHYVIEENTKYCLPLYLALQLNKHLRKIKNSHSKNFVSNWINNLPPEEKQLINVTNL